MTYAQRSVVIAFAENGMNLQRAADSLPCHRNTIFFHLDRVHETLKLNPRDFFDLQKLYKMAKEEEDAEA